MAYEKLALDVSGQMHSIPKDERLDFLKRKIAELPENERAGAEHIMGMTLLSIDHLPPDRRSAWKRFVEFFQWTDFVSGGLFFIGFIVVAIGKGTAEVEINLTDPSVKTNSVGYFMIIFGICLFLARGWLNKKEN